MRLTLLALAVAACGDPASLYCEHHELRVDVDGSSVDTAGTFGPERAVMVFASGAGGPVGLG